MLRVSSMSSGYGEVGVLQNISFDVENEIFAVLGANGAGKSTLLKTLANLLPVIEGRVEWDGQRTDTLPAHALPGIGVSYVPQEGNVFPYLTVAENLSIGALSYTGAREEKIEEIYALFPRLAERKSQLAGSLSGGEGQMLAVGRALAQDPRILLLDEPSAGLSPTLVETLFAKIAEVRSEQGVSIVLAEQNAAKALEIADRVLVLSLGQIHFLKPAKGLSTNALMEAYHI